MTANEFKFSFQVQEAALKFSKSYKRFFFVDNHSLEKDKWFVTSNMRLALTILWTLDCGCCFESNTVSLFLRLSPVFLFLTSVAIRWRPLVKTTACSSFITWRHSRLWTDWLWYGDLHSNLFHINNSETSLYTLCGYICLMYKGSSKLNSLCRKATMVIFNGGKFLQFPEFKSMRTGHLEFLEKRAFCFLCAWVPTLKRIGQGIERTMESCAPLENIFFFLSLKGVLGLWLCLIWF